MAGVKPSSVLLTSLLKKVLVCFLSVLSFFLAENALAEPPKTVDEHNKHSVLQVSNNSLESERVLMESPKSWERLGKTILHKIAGDDSRAYFGFQPTISVIQNPLPLAALTRKRTLVFSSGLLSLIKAEEEFAFLIAHELAHEMLGHLSDQHRHSHWTLEEEVMADKVAVRILTEAGYDHTKGASLLQRLEAFGSESGVRFEELHPTLRGRRSNLLQGFGFPPQRAERTQVVSAG